MVLVWLLFNPSFRFAVVFIASPVALLVALYVVVVVVVLLLLLLMTTWTIMLTRAKVGHVQRQHPAPHERECERDGR